MVLVWAAIIDSVCDFDQPSGRTAFGSADAIVAYVEKHKLTVDWLLETHAHADHLSAAPYIKQQAGGPFRIGFGQMLGDHRLQQIFPIGAAQPVIGPAVVAHGAEIDRPGARGGRGGNRPR